MGTAWPINIIRPAPDERGETSGQIDGLTTDKPAGRMVRWPSPELKRVLR